MAISITQPLMQHLNHNLKPFYLLLAYLLLGLSLFSLPQVGLTKAQNQQNRTLIDQVLVIVNDDVIIESELNQQVTLIKQQLKTRAVTPPPEPILKKQLLERMIVDSIQLQLAKNQGIRVTDEEVNQTLSQIAAQNEQNLKDFQASLNAQGVSYPVFRAQIQREMLLNKIQQASVSPSIKISDQEINNFLNSQAAQTALAADYHLLHILISLPSKPSPELLREKKAVADDVFSNVQNKKMSFQEAATRYSDGRFALKGGDLGWRSSVQLPDLFVRALEPLSINGVTQPFRSANGFHLLKLKAKRGGTEHFVPQTKVRHILIKPNQVRSDQQSEQLILDLSKQLRQGADFADLARTYSDDPGSAQAGGELGWVIPSSLTQTFADTMQATKKGERSKAFRSRYGWHILEVLDRRDQDMSQDYRESQARELIFKQRYSQALQTWLREIRQEAYVDFKSDYLAD